MLTRERILNTVRTYPTPSTTNRETVCIGGITAGGEWRRLYPIPLRYLPENQQFRTWDVIEVDVRASTRDGRPESRRPHLPTLKLVDHLHDWEARCEWVKRTSFQSLRALIDAGRSLGPVTITKVIDLLARKETSEWDATRRAKLDTLMLYDQPLPLEKIPLQFRLIWHDGDDVQHDSLVISWEMAQTWRRYRKAYADPVGEMRTKLLGDYFGTSRKPEFFMGNHSQRRHIFMVCGWFVPPRGVAENEYLW